MILKRVCRIHQIHRPREGADLRCFRKVKWALNLVCRDEVGTELLGCQWEPMHKSVKISLLSVLTEI